MYISKFTLLFIAADGYVPTAVLVVFLVAYHPQPRSNWMAEYLAGRGTHLVWFWKRWAPHLAPIEIFMVLEAPWDKCCPPPRSASWALLPSDTQNLFGVAYQQCESFHWRWKWHKYSKSKDEHHCWLLPTSLIQPSLPPLSLNGRREEQPSDMFGNSADSGFSSTAVVGGIPCWSEGCP